MSQLATDQLLNKKDQKIAQLEQAIALEAALERVRSRIMLMQRSHELRDVVSVMYDEMELLGLAKWGCNIMICHQDKEVFEFWLAEETDANQTRNYFVKGKEHPVYQKIWTNWENQTNTFTLHHQDEYKLAFDKYWIEETDFKHLPDEVKANVYNKNEVFLNYAPMKHGLLNAISYEKISDKLLTILTRFAKVFEQTYTRFLDLQKAEAQAREAQIEAALERVRASTMAMHHSSDLTKSAAVLFEQIKLLGAKIFSCGFVLCEADNPLGEQWMSVGNNKELLQQYIPHEEEPHHLNIYKAWLAGEALLAQKFEGEVLQAVFAFLAAQPSVQKNLEKIIDKDTPFPSLQILHAAYFSKGYLLIITTEEYTEKDIFIRFAKVFEQTYTRFLDLQKAEAQAREAQIETALERVRAASMAMYRSKELQKVVGVTFDQLQSLSLPIDGCQLITFDDDTRDLNFWLATPDMVYPVQIKVPYFDNPIFTKFWEARNQGDTFMSFDLTRSETLDFYNHLYKKTALGSTITKERWKKIQSIKHGFTTSGGIQKNTSLFIFNFRSHHFTKEENSVINRFAKVFEQTYTRFLDLQKAEAQAREAQIEAALERVRAASMAMHKSEELIKVATVMYEEFKKLGMTQSASAGFGLIDEEKKIQLMWSAQTDSRLLEFSKIPLFGDEVLAERYAAWKNKKSIFSQVLKAQDLKKHLEVVMPADRMSKKEEHAKIDMPDPTYFYFGIFKQGYLQIISADPLSKEHQHLLVRFAYVFEQSYTRFSDLKKAEAQAREARIEAALERVRTKSMSMHKSEDLVDVLNVIFEQMHQLGFDSYHIIFGIVDLDKRVIEHWSQGIREFQFTFRFEMPIIDNYVQNHCIADWQSGKEFSILEVEGNTKREYDETLFQLPDLADMPEMIKNNIRAMKKAFFSLAFTQHGILSANGPTPLPEEQQSILVRFAKVLDLTFTRMLDLQTAENQARELEIIFQENERLLHSILPMTIAEQLKKSPKTIVKRFEQVSILFADIVGFTVLSEQLSPQEVVDILNGLFSRFDDLTDKYGLEKIKTIGDAYMVAAGVPEEKDNHAQLMFAFAKDMLQTLQGYNQIIGTNLKIRIGISSGPVVAGVIGKKKFAYDLWGDTVNTAARMEAYGQASCIQVSPTTYRILKKEATFEKIPKVEIKGKGTMDVYVWQGIG